MTGGILPLRQYALWRGAQLKKKHRDDNFAFTF
jgi:hypothetical protein